MRRVVVTGLGIVSSIGNNADEVLASLKAGTSGIVASPAMEENGFRSRIAGNPNLHCVISATRVSAVTRPLTFPSIIAAGAHAPR